MAGLVSQGCCSMSTGQLANYNVTAKLKLNADEKNWCVAIGSLNGKYIGLFDACFGLNFKRRTLRFFG